MKLDPAPDSLLQAIGRLLGLPDLAWDEQHSCTLSFGDDVHLTLYADDERPDLTMYTLLGVLPADAPSAVWRELMEANLFGKGTGGAALGYEPDSQWVYLSRRLPTEGLNAQQWLGEIQAFVSACRQWQSRWSQLQAQSSGVQAPSAGTGFVETSARLASVNSGSPLTAGSAISPADFRSGPGAGMLRA
jgi:hypothetical protein